MADESHWKHCWWLRAGKRGWFKEIPQGWVCMTRVPKKEKLQKKKLFILWIAAAASFRLLFQKLCFIEVAPGGSVTVNLPIWRILWLRSNQHQSWRPSAPEIPSMQDVGGIHAEKTCFASPFFLFKEKDGCFLSSHLANFLDVFAFESNIVGWESFERWVFESFWTLPFHACYSLQESPGIHVCYDGRRFTWKELYISKLKPCIQLISVQWFSLETPIQPPKNNSHTFFCWGYSRKKQPGKQNKIQPFWGQGMEHHQRIQLGSHRFRFTSQILTPMCLDCLDGRWLRLRVMFNEWWLSWHL